MALIIDGYNLLYAANIVGGGVGPRALEKSRLALQDFVASSIDPAEIPNTIIVFDASQAPPGLPRVVKYRGLTVQFASDYEDADTLIEELILESNVPKSLTVVSSDHRIQRAARKRKSKAIDSDVWYTTVQRERREREQSGPSPGKPICKPSAGEVKYWMDVFGEGEGGVSRDDLNHPFPPGYLDDLEEEGSDDSER